MRWGKAERWGHQQVINCLALRLRAQCPGELSQEYRCSPPHPFWDESLNPSAVQQKLTLTLTIIGVVLCHQCFGFSVCFVLGGVFFLVGLVLVYLVSDVQSMMESWQTGLCCVWSKELSDHFSNARCALGELMFVWTRKMWFQGKYYP